MDDPYEIMDSVYKEMSQAIDTKLLTMKVTQKIAVFHNEVYFNIDRNQADDIAYRINDWLNDGWTIATSFVIGNYTVIVFQKVE